MLGFFMILAPEIHIHKYIYIVRLHLDLTGKYIRYASNYEL